MRLLGGGLVMFLQTFPWSGLGEFPLPPDDRGAYVQARLVLVQRGPGCGGVFVGSRALYEVQYGPPGLRGAPLEVVVGCIEFPMTEWDGVGDLEAFVPGDVHYLHISKDNLRGVEVYDNPKGRVWFLLAASRKPLVRKAPAGQ